MPRPTPDLMGHVFARLTCIEKTSKHGRTYWLCKCSCGNTVEVAPSNLTSNQIKSCGCWNAELRLARNTRHGKSRTPTYNAWKTMIGRCHNPNHEIYADYGARGITVCKRWCDRFEAFEADMGPSPVGMTLDRRNNDRGYSKTNCRWATGSEQMRNTRRTVLNASDVSRIRKLYSDGKTPTQIRKLLKLTCTVSNIGHAARGLTWKDHED